MKYIKKFNKHTQYQEYINNSNPKPNLPNLSFCELEDDLHLNYWSDPRIIAKFNVDDDSVATRIFGGKNYFNISVLDNFSKIEVDGVEISLSDLDENNGDYQLSEGVHIIKYTLLDSTLVAQRSFQNCIKLTSVKVPDSVTSFGLSAFYGCTNLTMFNSNISGECIIKDNIITIGDYAFGACPGLTSVTIPNSVTTIGQSAFNGCSGLTSVTIPNTVNSIGEKCFWNCTNITNAVINCDSIGVNAFSGCSSLTDVIISSDVTTIGQSAFWNCENLTNAVINAITIGNGAFYQCASLTSVTIGNGVTSIGYDAFIGCSGLTSVTIPDSVISIGYDAFQNCTGLTTVTIGNGVTSIDYQCFSSCTSLTSITIRSTTPPTVSSNTFDYNASGRKIYVPAASVETYKTANVWSYYYAADIEAIP